MAIRIVARRGTAGPCKYNGGPALQGSENGGSDNNNSSNSTSIHNSSSNMLYTNSSM